MGGLPVDIRKMTPSVQARLGRSMQAAQLRMSAAEVMRAVVVLLGAEGRGSGVAAGGGQRLAVTSGREDGRVGGGGGEAAGSAGGKRKRHHQGDTAADAPGRQLQQQQGAVETSLVYCRGRTACFLMRPTGAACDACCVPENPDTTAPGVAGSRNTAVSPAAEGGRATCRCCDAAAVGRLAAALTGSGEGRGGVAALLGVTHPEGWGARSGAAGSGRLELRAYLNWGPSMDLLMCHGFREVGVGASAL